MNPELDFDKNPSAFFASLPSIADLTDITDPQHFYDLPADWYIALTHVVNAAEAIRQGRYKDVNSIAAAVITALLNQVPGVDLPFSFGGDGATILLPPAIIPEAWQALLATGQLARDAFDLELRTALIPVRDVLEAGYQVRVARLKMSDNFSQAMFNGGGVAYAEKLVKNLTDPELATRYLVTGTGSYQVDFTGFECRWRPVRSPSDETLTLLVQSLLPGEPGTAIYREVVRQIESLYGDRKTRHPLSPRNLRLQWFPAGFWNEARIRYHDASFGRRLKLALATLIGRMAIRFNIQGWGGYPQLMIEATDTDKFDDLLRMVMSGTVEQREQLRAYLEARFQAGELVYGMHTAQDALITCIVYDYFGRQVHFVDASNGGYAQAAQEMQTRLQDVLLAATLRTSPVRQES